VLALLWHEEDGLDQAVLIEGLNAATNLVAEGLRQRVESVLFVQLQNTEAPFVFSVRVVLNAS